MTWEIISYGSGDFLRLVFNGVAMIFGNGDYIQGMQVSALIAFVGLFIRAAFDREVMASFRWFVVLLVFIMAVLAPKVDVMITDRINPANSAVVSNVPLGLAGTASTFSIVGDYLTKAFETVFSLPDQLNYSSNGFLFANSLIDSAKRFQIKDGRLNENFSEFMATCVVVDGIGNGRFTWNELKSADNLSVFFSERVARNAAYFRYFNADGTSSVLPCRLGWTSTLLPEIEATYTDILAKGMPSDFIQRFGGMESATNKLTASMGQALDFTTGAGGNPQAFVMQKAISNSMASGVHKLSQQVGADGFAEYIHSGAELQRMNAYQVYGRLAGEKLPLLRTIFEAVIYAIFPFVALIAVINPAKVSIAYVKALAWINIWPMLFAILHFVMTYYTSGVLPQYTTAYGGLSLAASSQMDKFNADIIGTTGYLAMSIPMLAWMLISNSGAMMAGIAGRVMQGYDKSVDLGAQEVTQGAGQRLGTSWEMAGAAAGGGYNIQQTSLGETGTRTTSHADGSISMDQAKSNLHIQSNLAESVVNTATNNHSKAVAFEEQAKTAHQESVSAALSDSNRVMEELRNTHGASNTFQQAETSLHQQTYQELSAKFDEWARKENIAHSDEMKQQVLQSVSANLGVGVPGASPVSAGAGMTFSRADSEAHTRTAQEVQEVAARFSQSDNFADVAQSTAQAVRGMAAEFSLSESDGNVRALDASLERAEQTDRTLSEAVAKRDVAEQALSEAKSLSSSLTMDGGRAFLATAQNRGMDSGEIDKLLLQASGPASAEQRAAMDQVREIAFAATQGSMAQPDPYNSQDLDQRFADGRAGVDGTYQGSRGEVQAQGGANSRYVDGKNHVDRERVEGAVSHAQSAITESMTNPEQVRVYGDQMNRHADRLANEGTTIKQDAAMPDDPKAAMERAMHLRNLGLDPDKPMPVSEAGKPYDQMSSLERQAEATRSAYLDPTNNDNRIRRS